MWIKVILDIVDAIHMVSMKDHVFLMINARMIFFVDTKIVLPHLMMMLIAVLEINLRVQIIQIIFSQMM